MEVVMSLQLLDTVASLLTVTIVAATAVAALVQLAHLRAGNQIHALLSVSDKLNSSDYFDALTVANRKLGDALTQPAYRQYELALHRRLPPPADVDPAFVVLHQAVLRVGNTFEDIGVLLKNHVVDPNIFVDQYGSEALDVWKRLGFYMAFIREAAGDTTLWENFEYLVVLSEDWRERFPSTYPKGVRRIELRNPWPIAAH
jgi:hypothetical protein